MQTALRIIILAGLFGYFIACAPVKFEAVPASDNPGNPIVSPTRADICPKVCSGASCVYKCKIEKMVGEGLVDILIINDNSGSMSVEQSKMADRFPTFLSALGNLDFRIAMTTTDISSRYSQTPYDSPNPVNPARVQDGNLIEFSPGVKYLQRSTPNKDNLFFNTIRRDETRICDQSGYTNCPSSDERGIFAANLVLERTAGEFMRPQSHLAVIVLSDEDERGISPLSAKNSNDQALSAMYPIEERDRPETFISRMRSQYPEKTFSFHSIIIKPGDTACRDAQTNPGANIRGVEGYYYSNLSKMTGGKIGSICASDYGAQLTDIGYSIQGKVTSLPFACRPINDQYQLFINNQPDNSTPRTPDFTAMELRIDANLPPLTKVRMEWDCAVVD